MDVHENAYEYIVNGLLLSETEWAALEAMYHATIAFTDDRMGVVLDHLSSLDLKDTVVVVTADHGEFLGERGLLSQQFLGRDALVHVPLVISGLEDVTDLAIDESDVVQHGGVMHTLLGLAGASTAGLQTVDLREERREFAFSQADPSFDHVLAENPELDVSDRHESPTTGIRTQDHKLVHSDDKTNLYRLPDEETDMSEDMPDLLAELFHECESFLEAVRDTPYRRDVTDDYDESVEKRLEDLGYRWRPPLLTE